MAWEGSDRRAHLPSNWLELREKAHLLNPRHICHACGQPGGEALDHKNGDRDDHRQENLDWIHDWRSVRAGVSPVNCHQRKTRRDRPSLWRPKEQHPAL
jgi:5-methylcytosine-specific restriction protein A